MSLMLHIQLSKGAVAMVNIMKDQAVDYLSKNLRISPDILRCYENRDDPTIWLSGRINQPAFIPAVGIELDLPTLQWTPASSEVADIKVFYEAAKTLSDSYAADIRLWAGLAHTMYYDYVLDRCGGDYSANKLENAFLFPSNTRSYLVNTLSRLWWFGRKMYCDNAAHQANPWYILDYISNDLNGFAFRMFGSNWANDFRIVQYLFDALVKYESIYGYHLERLVFNNLCGYINRLCGSLLMDVVPYEFLEDKVFAFVNKERGL